ncbi:MAG: hypothetical protein OIN85_02765 [Candidatus Methanoperedens sp.]|nr:hypothetical protein [Candidatus Methanoperedens sp.]
MKSSFIFSDKAIESDNIDFQSWLGEASKEERIEIARQIASTVEKSDDEISYIDMSNLRDMPKEKRIWIAKKIVSSIPHDWGYASC